MREKLEQIRTLLEEIISSLGESGPVADPEPPLLSDLSQLKMLLDSGDWPEAVFSAHIADENSESDKQDRAMGIAEIMLPPCIGKKFLDFGCGEGHVANYVARDASVSVGFDLARPASSPFAWEEKTGVVLLTTDMVKVQQEGPYDVILIYDVIDHCESDPADVLKNAASMLAPDGQIIMRCHPWCGRHGGHAYRKLNKAFVHLVFSEEELSEMGVDVEHNNKVIRPLKSYARAIDESGLKKVGEPEIDSQEVESFFRETPVVRDRILKNWGISEWAQDPPQFQMSQCFVDYVLKKG